MTLQRIQKSKEEKQTIPPRIAPRRLAIRDASTARHSAKGTDTPQKGSDRKIVHPLENMPSRLSAHGRCYVFNRLLDQIILVVQIQIGVIASAQQDDTQPNCRRHDDAIQLCGG
jgi:hypothetical protein